MGSCRISGQKLRPQRRQENKEETHQDPAAYRFEPLLGSLVNQLVGDGQIAPSSQAVGSRAVADVSAAWTPPVPALPDLMNVLPHPDVQAGSTPEAPPLATHNALPGVVAGAVRLLINSLLPVTTDRLRLAWGSLSGSSTDWCMCSSSCIWLMAL